MMDGLRKEQMPSAQQIECPYQTNGHLIISLVKTRQDVILYRCWVFSVLSSQ